MIIHFLENITMDLPVLLDAEESLHCIKVLRKKNGDIINVTDGKGYLYKAEIINDNHKRCELKIVEKIIQQSQRKYYLNIAIAPTKNMERFEWFIEKAVEIGIDEITPILTEHSERKVLKMERIEKIIVATIKQAQVYHLPKINGLQKFDEFIRNNTSRHKFIAHCEDSTNKHELRKICSNIENATILIGPEGDFSHDEISRAVKNDFLEVSLSANRLRTETAAIVACNIFAVNN